MDKCRNRRERPMRFLVTVVALAGLGLSLAACHDVTSSSPDMGVTLPAASVMHGHQGTRPASLEPLALKPGAPALATTRVSFWAVQGERTGVDVAYRGSGDDGTRVPFLRFAIPKRAQLIDPDGRPLARGDSIFITIHVVPGRLAARFAPHGLVFANHGAAELSLHYGFGHLDGRAARLLKVWYQPVDGDPWTEQRSRIDRKDDLVVARIDHFSNYAVAF